MKTQKITHLASAGANQIVATGKAILHRIIIGADVATGDITVSDSPSSGTSNVKLQVTGSTLMTAHGTIEVGALFENGITLGLTNQTKVTLIWEPVAA